MSEPFQRSLFPGQAVICGRVLPPLTFWRLQCLQAIGSPFLGHDSSGQVTLADLLLAVRAVRTPNLVPPDLQPTFRDRFTYRHRRHAQAWFEREAASFITWLSLHQLCPELWQCEDSDATREITAPLILTQIAALMQCGMAHAEAWDTAPGYATWLIAAHAERQTDRVKFHRDEDDDINAELEALDQRSEAELIAQARADLSDAAFDRWLSARHRPASTDH